MDKKKTYEPLTLSKSGRITIYTEIIQRCGACIGRIENEFLESTLAITAQRLCAELESEFKLKEKDE